MSDLKDMFFEECEELLEALSSGLIDLEQGNGDGDTINAMFRSVHSIKGGAGAFGLDGLVSFAHVFENVMDDLRSDRLTMTPDILTLLCTSADHLSDLVSCAKSEDGTQANDGASLISDLKLLSASANGGAPDTAADQAAEEVVEFNPITLDLDLAIPDLPEVQDNAGGTDLALAAGEIAIHFSAQKSLYANGHDPALLIRALKDLGGVKAEADLSDVKPLSDEGAQEPSIRWSIVLTPDDGVDLGAVREVFEFVEGQCQLDIQQQDVAEEPIVESPEMQTPDPGAVAVAPEAAPQTPGNAPVVSAPDAAPADVSDSTSAAVSKKEPAANKGSIRVELDRVDRLVNLVGELVISEAMLRQSMSEMPRGSNNSSVEEAMGQLRQLSGVLQESVMAIRAQPVRGLFQRMSRIVRESAREAGKTAKLVTIGDTTEVDKTVIERLVEPLTHMIRNSVDHGLETAADRESAGKAPAGTIRLEAAHRSGRVVISLSDDGAGINRAKVRQIGLDKGLISPEDDLSDSDIDALLFEPGFSTAKEVSNLSGRGVGMDVVRTAIQSLGGRISLESTPGSGTTVRISLPLTLAVLEGMVVHVDDQSLVVPTLALRETLTPGQANLHDICDGDPVLLVDGMLIPVIDLGVRFGYRSEKSDLSSQSILLIESESGKRTALAVDAIADQREVVIKGLEQNYQQIPGIAAATILGDGKIALIVDTEQMFVAPVSRPDTTKQEPDAIGVNAYV